MNIGSGNGYPASALSNFAPHKFVIDGVECASLEGWIQSLKFKNPDMQKEVCKLVGKAAKYKGKEKDWRREQKLYWKGKEIDRHSTEYQKLLDKAYQCVFDQNEGFRCALKATGSAVLQHTIGKSDPKETVLTRNEFCSRLMELREKLNN